MLVLPYVAPHPRTRIFFREPTLHQMGRGYVKSFPLIPVCWDRTFQIHSQHIRIRAASLYYYVFYYFLRTSEWSDISSQFVVHTEPACLVRSAIDLPRQRSVKEPARNKQPQDHVNGSRMATSVGRKMSLGAKGGCVHERALWIPPTLHHHACKFRVLVKTETFENEMLHACATARKPDLTGGYCMPALSLHPEKNSKLMLRYLEKGNEKEKGCSILKALVQKLLYGGIY